MFKKFLLNLTFLFLSVSVFAQRQDITGSIIDDDRSPLVSATVMLMTPDSIFKTFATTDLEGSFEMKGVPQGSYYIQVNYLGFQPFYRILEVSSIPLDLGVMELITESKTMDEIVVSGQRSPVEIRKDTIGYNAESFQTQPNADVEALLKKLPGVEVDRDGNVKAQGEDVQKILVDGKEFFGTDPKIATKNLPADAIKKVQVYDSKSEEAEFTGIDDGERNKTINLELKDSHKKGTFGNVEAGGGDDGRYQGNLSLNRFNENNQMSILGMGNNTNQTGFSFTDYVNFSGGMGNAFGGGGGRGGSGGSSGVPLDFNNNRPGINTTWATGINYNKDWGKKTKLRTNYFYNSGQTDLNQRSEKEYTLPEYSYLSIDDTETDSKQFNHRINAILEHDFKNNHSIRLTSNISYAEGDGESASANQILSSLGELENDDNRTNEYKNDQLSLNGSLLYRKKFKKKGRSFSATLAMSDNDQDSESTLNSLIGYYKFDRTRVDTLQQLNGSLNDNKTYRIESSFSEPLGNNWFAQLNYRWRKNEYDALVNVYDEYLTDPILNALLSNQYQNGYLYNRFGAELKRNSQKSNLTVGLDYQNSALEGKNISSDIEVSRRFNFVLPYFRYNYYFTSMKSFRFRYSTQVREPSVQQLQPVPNNSNPLFLSLGNPDLKPEYTHSANFGFNSFDQFNFITFFSNIRLSYSTDKISTAQITDNQNVTTSMPVNVDNDFTANGFLSFGAPIKPLKFTFDIRPNVTYNKGISFINGIENSTETMNHSYTLRLENRKKEILDIGFGGSLGFNDVKFDVLSSQNSKYQKHSAFIDVGLNLDKIITLNSSFDYSIYENEGFDLRSEIPIWNASISKFILKDNAGEIKLSTFDLLNRRQGITQNAAINYVENKVSNTLGRYFLLSFRYNIKAGIAAAQGAPQMRMNRRR